MTKNQLRDWAFARVELGLSASEYLDLAPVEYTALIEAWNAKQRRSATQTAALFAFLANLIARPDPPATAADFLPVPVKTYDNPEQQADAIMAGFHAAFPNPKKPTK